MFSFMGNATNQNADFKEQESMVNKELKGNFNNSFGFMGSVREIIQVDEKIANMEEFINSKIKYLEEFKGISESNSVNKQMTDNLRFFIAIGIIDTISSDKDQLNHIRMQSLNNANFKKTSLFEDMLTYLKEYSSKLKVLKDIVLDKGVPENTGYQHLLQQKLHKFLNKTKYYIFDIYLNHYIQYVYLLFAINVYSKTEMFFKFNAEHQKEIALLSKTDDLIKARDTILVNDKDNINTIYGMITSLISKTDDIFTFNKPSDAQLKMLNTQKEQAGGNDSQIPTAADEIIQRLLEKHTHFYDVYKTTRDTMPLYFSKINEMVISKIDYLKELKNKIMVLEPKHYDLFLETDGLFSKMMAPKELAKSYRMQHDGVVASTIESKLKNITANIENHIETNSNFAKNLQKETEALSNTLTQGSDIDNLTGGFIRAGTRPVRKSNRG